MKACESVLDGIGKPDKRKTGVIMPVFKGKGDEMRCGSYRWVKLLLHAMKIVVKVLGKRIRTLIILNKCRLDFYARKRNNGCNTCCEEGAEGISK